MHSKRYCYIVKTKTECEGYFIYRHEWMALQQVFPEAYSSIKKKVTKDHIKYIQIPLNKVKDEMMQYFQNRKDYQVMITLKESNPDTVKQLRRLNIETFITEDINRNEHFKKFMEYKQQITGIGLEIERMNYEVDKVMRRIIHKWKQVDGAAGNILNENLELVNENLILHRKLFPRDTPSKKIM